MKNKITLLLLAVVSMISLDSFSETHKTKEFCDDVINIKHNFNQETIDLLHDCELAGDLENTAECQNLNMWIYEFQQTGITEVYHECIKTDNYPKSSEIKIIYNNIDDHYLSSRLRKLLKSNESSVSSE